MSEVVAFLIGAAAGYLGVRLGDVGEVAIGLLIVGLVACYVWRNRISNASAVSLGAALS